MRTSMAVVLQTDARGPGSRARAPALRSRSGRGSRGRAKTRPMARILPRSSYGPRGAVQRYVAIRCPRVSRSLPLWVGRVRAIEL
jgi:hypothetical protein